VVTETERVRLYIRNVEEAIDKIVASKDRVGRNSSIKEIINLVRLYLEDSKYYVEKGDVFTALSCIAYAEGLLDSLQKMGLLDIEWRSLSELSARPKVVVAGTFDIIHPGHIALIYEAWKKGRVYVIVARDSSVEKFKGRPPVVPEKQRLQVVSSIKYVYKALLGNKDDILKPIEELKPDIILLGPDQWADENWLLKELRKRGLNTKVERLRQKVDCELCSSSEIVKRACTSYNYPKNSD